MGTDRPPLAGAVRLTRFYKKFKSGWYALPRKAGETEHSSRMLISRGFGTSHIPRLQCPAEYHVITLRKTLIRSSDGDGRIKVLCFPGLSYFRFDLPRIHKAISFGFKLGQQGIEGLYGPRKLVHQNVVARVKLLEHIADYGIGLVLLSLSQSSEPLDQVMNSRS